MIDMPADFLYWTSEGDDKIKRADSSVLGGDITDVIVSGSVNYRGIDYNRTANRLFWVDSDNGEIKSSDKDGLNESGVVAGLTSPTFLTVHEGSGLIFWVDNNSTDVNRADLDGSNQITIHTGFSSLGGVTVHEASGLLFYVDGFNGRIRRSDLAGNNDIQIIQTGAPFDVAIDDVNDKVYWTDTSNTRLGRANLDGSSVNIFIDNSTPYHGITIDPSGEYMYVTDLANGVIYKTDTATATEQTFQTGLNAPYDAVLVPLIESHSGAISLHMKGHLPESSGISLYIDGPDAKFYFSSTSQIFRADALLNSREFLSDFPAGLAKFGISVHETSGYVFWTHTNATDENRIIRSDLDGSNRQTILTSGDIGQTLFVYADELTDKIYWSEVTEDKIRRADFDGSNIEDIIDVNANGILVDNNILYWKDNDSSEIISSGLSGGSSGLVASVGAGAFTFAIDPIQQLLFFTDTATSRISSVATSGGPVTLILEVGDGVGYPEGIDVDSTARKIYWNNDNTVVKKANFDGSNVETVGTSFAGLNEIYVVDTPFIEHAGSIQLYVQNNKVAENIDLYVDGSRMEEGSVDLFVNGLAQVSRGIDLVIEGVTTSSGSITMMVRNNWVNEPIDLFTEGHSTLSSGIPLHMHGHEYASGAISLFINGAEIETFLGFVECYKPPTGSIDLLIYGKPAGETRDIFFTLSSVSLFTFNDPVAPDSSGSINTSSQTTPAFVRVTAGTVTGVIDDTLIGFVRCDNSPNNSIDLFTKGHGVGQPVAGIDKSSSIDLFIEGSGDAFSDEYIPVSQSTMGFVRVMDGDSESHPLFIYGKQTGSQSTTMFVGGVLGTPTGDINFYVYGQALQTGSMDMFTFGISGTPTGSITMFLRNTEIGESAVDISLYSHGF